jgi:hypothetical protein
MGSKNNNRLFYTCSLIEYLSRIRKRERKDIVELMGEKSVQRIYEYADIFHCEPIEKVATEFAEECAIEKGECHNTVEKGYRIPDYWTIGEVYERLIEDSYEDKDIIKGVWEVYHSWISELICDYNTDFYYQSREYIAACYKAGKVLD